VLNKETYLIRQAALGNARGQIMKLMPQWTEGMSREEIRQELVRRAEARHNSLRGKIGRWTLLVIFVSLRNEETRPDAGWLHGLFWLGWGLFTLGLWRQWLGM
jgi:hypothetical protein